MDKPKPEREWPARTKKHFKAIVDLLYEFCSDSDIEDLTTEQTIQQFGLWLTMPGTKDEDPNKDRS